MYNVKLTNDPSECQGSQNQDCFSISLLYAFADLLGHSYFQIQHVDDYALLF